jgi:hypothetical protein
MWSHHIIDFWATFFGLLSLFFLLALCFSYFDFSSTICGSPAVKQLQRRMSDPTTLVQVFSDSATQKQGHLTSYRYDVASYLSTTSEISSREILDFRLSTAQFNSFMEYFRDLIGQIKDASFSIEAMGAHIEAFFRLLVLLVQDYDFSFQLGDYGGHALLKQSQRLQGKLPVNIGNIIDEVIAAILECGVQFPLAMSTSHKESVVKPLVFEFKVRPVIIPDISSAVLTLAGPASGPSPVLEDGEHTLGVYVRQVPAGMHGAGQAAVGYVMWSSAVILSRWYVLHISTAHLSAVQLVYSIH